MRRGDRLLVGAAPGRVVAADGAAALPALDGLEPGFWVGACSFELGHVLERVTLRAASYDPPDVPDVLFARFDALAVVAPNGAIAVRGEGPGRSLLERPPPARTPRGPGLARWGRGGRRSPATSSRPGCRPSSDSCTPASATR